MTRIAITPKDRETVYKIRYACYNRCGSIPPNDTQQFSDSFDALPNQFSFLMPDWPATVRISVSRPDIDWHDTPARRVFGDHPALKRLGSYVEANRLCFLERAHRDSFCDLLGHMAAMADRFETGWLVACPRVEHVQIYQRMFAFEPIAPARKYFGVAFETQLLAITRQSFRAHAARFRPMREAWEKAMDTVNQIELLEPVC